MLPRPTKKRELTRESNPEPQIPQPPQKKSKQLERRFKKRTLQEVLDELCVRVETNDRQLTNNLIRELDTEHVRVISDENFESTCKQILKACLNAKLDSVSSELFSCLLSMFARGSSKLRKAFVSSLGNYCDGLAVESTGSMTVRRILVEAEEYSSTDSEGEGTPVKEAKKEAKKEEKKATKKVIRPESPVSSMDSEDVDSTDGEQKSRIRTGSPRSPYSSYSPDLRKKKKTKKSTQTKELVQLNPEEDITIVDAFFLKPSLDCGVLGIYTIVLKEGNLEAKDVPKKIHLCARRSISQTSLSNTANRIAALEFHVAVAIASSKSKYRRELEEAEEEESIENMLIRLASDRDFRVRKAVAEGLLELSSIQKLSESTYEIAKSFMKDQDSDIRIAAIRLLVTFADGSHSDDAFSEICDAINDIEIAVRVEAAKKLGDFKTVSEDLVFQTLDKKMMRSTKNKEVVKVEQSLFALSKKQSQNRERRWKFQKQATKPQEHRGGWSRGKELHSSAPSKEEKAEDAEGEKESIIPHGACGAFVSALEDEFMDVRKAAVYSLGRLACTRPTFAVSALEYLADMFNDEMADVRLDAINALTPLISHGQMNTEQLNVISKCLDDAKSESRQAMRELLKRAQFADVNCVEMCVKALLACLRRFPKDTEQIYSCMAVIGRNHAVQIQSIMRSLLGIHLVFHTREQSIEDQEYVGKLIMVLNAAASQPSLVLFFPEFVHRHYRLLRASYPNIVTSIGVLDEEKQTGKGKNWNETTTERAEDVVVDTYKRLCSIPSTVLHNDRIIKREDIFRDTSAISLYNSSVSGAARLIFCLGEVSSTVDSMSNTVLQGGELTNSRQLIAQSIEEMESMTSQFSGISRQIKGYLKHCKVYLMFLEMLVWMMQSMTSQKEVIAQGRMITEMAREAVLDFEMSDEFMAFSGALESIFFPPVVIPLGNAIQTDEKRKIITPSTLMNLLQGCSPELPPKFPPVSSIHLKFARITSPNKDTAVEECLKFYAHLPHAIPLEFDLFNVKEEELETIRIKTIHPDGRMDIMRPRRQEFREMGMEEDGEGKKKKRWYQVTTQVKIMSTTPWSDPAEIDVVIGIQSNNKFVALFESPSCFQPAHIRVRIHPTSR